MKCRCDSRLNPPDQRRSARFVFGCGNRTLKILYSHHASIFLFLLGDCDGRSPSSSEASFVFSLFRKAINFGTSQSLGCFKLKGPAVHRTFKWNENRLFPTYSDDMKLTIENTLDGNCFNLHIDQVREQLWSNQKVLTTVISRAIWSWRFAGILDDSFENQSLVAIVQTFLK